MVENGYTRIDETKNGKNEQRKKWRLDNEVNKQKLGQQKIEHIKKMHQRIIA